MSSFEWFGFVATPPVMLLGVAWAAVLLAPWLNRRGR